MRHLISGYFGTEDFTRLARVLAHSAARHCPSWQRTIVRISERPFVRGPQFGQSHVANTQKIQFWLEAVAALPDGAEILLIDADTVIVRPLDDVWDLDFDVAYTTKAATAKIPFNTGVVFMRISPVVRVFLQAWRDRQVQMLAHALEAERWRRLMVGLNQSALAAELDAIGLDPQLEEPAVVEAVYAGATPMPIRFRRLPCVEWNCEDASWAAYDWRVTRIIHVKSALRDSVFRRRPALSLRPLVNVWQSVEQDALMGPPAHELGRRP